MKPTDNTKSRSDDSNTTQPKRRNYNSPLRQQQSTKTRQRIIKAGTELAHESPSWSWENLTFRAVGERAGISERTVYRYFSTERKLRDAVIEHFLAEANINLGHVELSEFATLTTRTFESLAAFSVTPEPLADPTFSSIDQHRRGGILDAVTKEAPDWSDKQRVMTAAMLDMLWNPASYQRLVTAWGLDTNDAAHATRWMIGLVEDAIKQGKKP